MFVLARMSDAVRLAPHDFATDFQVALERLLNGKFANKVNM
jgi:DNA-directed RNA polymerase subunit E'/Rpb7